MPTATTAAIRPGSAGSRCTKDLMSVHLGSRRRGRPGCRATLGLFANRLGEQEAAAACGTSRLRNRETDATRSRRMSHAGLEARNNRAPKPQCPPPVVGTIAFVVQSALGIAIAAATRRSAQSGRWWIPHETRAAPAGRGRRCRLDRGGLHRYQRRRRRDRQGRLSRVAPWSDSAPRRGGRGTGSGYVDRHYFHSLYLREPGGVIYELAHRGARLPGRRTAGRQARRPGHLPPFPEQHRDHIEQRLTPLPDPRAGWRTPAAR
jgi:hypothetical protein